MNKDIISLLKLKWPFLALVVAVFAASVYFVFFSKDMIVAPIPEAMTKYKEVENIKTEVEQEKETLERILNENKTKAEATKSATVKEFYTVTGTKDIVDEFSPLFENVITLIKQNGLRLKSIKYVQNLEEDRLIKNGAGAYSGCQIDFELVGYYSQFLDLINGLLEYPYFISINKFEIEPYQYDKRILIANLSIVFYGKK